jgi:iron(3+)-hydroxamate import system permease protein FhuB
MAALIVGASLAVAGALMQGLTNNPMASPSILGINGGASLGLALAMLLVPQASFNTTIVFSFFGAALATACILLLAKKVGGRATPVYLALAGTAMGAVFTAITHMLAVFFSLAQDLSYWTAGGIAGVRLDQVSFVLPWTLVGLVLALAVSKQVSLLAFGEEVAIGLGANLQRVRVLAGLAVLILAGSSVALAGPIGFVGLLIPHIVRQLVGIDYRRVIPISALLGASLVILSDVVGRMLNPPYETPLGAVTALLGVPFFIYLASRKGGSGR